MSAIHRAHHPVDTHFALIDRDLGDLRRVAANVVDNRNSAEPSRGRRLAPVRLLSRQFEHSEQTRVFRQQPSPQFHRIFSTGSGQLIHEAFNEERVLRIANRTPVRDRDSDFGPVVVDQLVGNPVSHVVRAFRTRAIDTVPRRRPC
jgi:hypothetical protein